MSRMKLYLKHKQLKKSIYRTYSLNDRELESIRSVNTQPLNMYLEGNIGRIYIEDMNLRINEAKKNNEKNQL